MLTGGGDCPGLNAVLRALVRRCTGAGHEVVGVLDAWDGLLNGTSVPLEYAAVRDAVALGGTLLGTRRGSPLDFPDGVERTRSAMARLGLDGLVVVGGNGSLTVAHRLHADGSIPVVGVPKTIDNDVRGTDVCFGFHTAVQIATDAIDRVHTTSASHDRVMLVEVMGRSAGWIAAYAGIAAGACAILVPEEPFDLDELADALCRHHGQGRVSSVVVVAEGARPRDPGALALGAATDRWGRPVQGGVAVALAPEVEERTGFETRVVSLGHVQRGGSPTAYDRVLATRYGIAAAEAAIDGAWGTMVAFRQGSMERASLAAAAGGTRLLDESFRTTVLEPMFAF